VKAGTEACKRCGRAMAGRNMAGEKSHRSRAGRVGVEMLSTCEEGVAWRGVDCCRWYQSKWQMDRSGGDGLE
jgi:hypothetical protein